jgi:hypothetical protein
VYVDQYGRALGATTALLRPKPKDRTPAQRRMDAWRAENRRRALEREAVRRAAGGPARSRATAPLFTPGALRRLERVAGRQKAARSAGAAAGKVRISPAAERTARVRAYAREYRERFLAYGARTHRPTVRRRGADGRIITSTSSLVPYGPRDRYGYASDRDNLSAQIMRLAHRAGTAACFPDARLNRCIIACEEGAPCSSRDGSGGACTHEELRDRWRRHHNPDYRPCRTQPPPAYLRAAEARLTLGARLLAQARVCWEDGYRVCRDAGAGARTCAERAAQECSRRGLCFSAATDEGRNVPLHALQAFVLGRRVRSARVEMSIAVLRRQLGHPHQEGHYDMNVTCGSERDPTRRASPLRRDAPTPTRPADCHYREMRAHPGTGQDARRPVADGGLWGGGHRDGRYYACGPFPFPQD